jgi:hypothetical protein
LQTLAPDTQHATVPAAPTDKVDCSKIDEVLDDLGGAQGLTSLNDKYKIPMSADEQAKRCAEMTDAIKTLRKYNNQCYTALTQQVLSAILRTRSEFNDKYCKDQTSDAFKQGLDAGKCAAEQALDKVKEAEKKIIVSFQTLHEANISDDKVRVRRACCAVPEAKKHFLAATKDKCSAHEKLYSEYVDSYTEEAMGLICPSSDKLECDKLEAIKTDGVEPKTKFFLTPMVKLIKTLDH